MSDYNFYTIEIDCGLSGSLSGVYLAKPEDMDKLEGKIFRACDVLGKDSELSFKWEKDEECPKITINESWKVVDLDIVANELKNGEDEKFIFIGGFPFIDCLEEYDDE